MTRGRVSASVVPSRMNRRIGFVSGCRSLFSLSRTWVVTVTLVFVSLKTVFEVLMMGEGSLDS